MSTGTRLSRAAAGFHQATITQKRRLSPTVCHLRLALAPTTSDDDRLPWAPGQWVDFYVRGKPWVGGFSILGDPEDLPQVSLAVRRSAQAPAAWVHDESRVGSAVEIRVGGSCTWREAASREGIRPIVFVTGGIGIVPILAMYHAHWKAVAATASTSLFTRAPTALFYSAKTQEEMVFLDEVTELVQVHGKRQRGDRLVLSLSKQESWGRQQEERSNTEHCSVVEYETGRSQLRAFLASQHADSLYYLCGPPAMSDDAVQVLQEQGVDEADIIYEKWW
jgi:ferredoxin-NADP reductase